MKLFTAILFLIPFSFFARDMEKVMSFDHQGQDSLHSSIILSVEYQGDTLYIRVKHYSVCCEKFVTYDDYTSKKSLTSINLVHMNLDDGCLCHAERIIRHKIYLKDLKEVEFRLNGKVPEYGIEGFITPEWRETLDKKNKKKKKKKKK